MSKKKQHSTTLSKPKPKKAGPIDGYGIYEKRKIRNALRQIWQRSKARKLVKDRCTNDEGYEVCEECNKQVPKITVDHIIPIGDIEEPGFLERLMVNSEGLRGLCDPCHKVKTKEDVKNINKGKEERAKLKTIVTRLEVEQDVENKISTSSIKVTNIEDLI